MMTTGTLLSGLREGLNDPSLVKRVLVFDWYDGPVGGVLQVGDAGPVFRFQLLDDAQRADDEDLRAYGLYPLPPDTLSRLIEGIGAHMPPHWPVWVPIWRFPSEQIRRGVDALIDETMQSTCPLTWVVVGSIGTGPFRALPIANSQAS